ncbi:MAG: selenocysteine-specific translation elongation factor [Deltaproteobacteria bacterium]|nr:MAG: selenocysteine-specific translation elongation factor [Deltaproteobacteria bacterium]
MARHFVIGTAGHIDHGKTSLVRALTGVDLDRLPEERARGITIALGFTVLDLPDGRRLSFVDVPGHERLVRTMIAGATGLDAVLLCVSAVEGVMPQTREHLDILSILGVEQGVIALTMTDLVDEEMVELATMDVEDAVRGTFLEGAPIIATASPPGGTPRGLEPLRAALAALDPAERSSAGPFRLPIDRAFVRRGFGTVVTGTVRSGVVHDGEEVEVQPAGLRARVRGIQVHGDSVDHSRAGQRTALNLAGIERDDLARGQVVLRPGTIPLASIIDASYRHLAGAPHLDHDARVRLLVGTAEVMAVCSVLDSDDGLVPGRDHLVQLRTDSPIVVLPGDRFVLRRESPVETLGGGRVLDPWAPRARQRDHARAAAELARVLDGDRSVLLLRAGQRGLPPVEVDLHEITDGISLGDRVVHPEVFARLLDALVAAVDAWHAERPLTPGAPRRDLRRGPLRHLGDRAFDELVARAAALQRIELDGPIIRAPGFRVRPDPDQQALLDRLLATVDAAGLDGTPVAPLMAEDPDAFMFLVGEGLVDRVADRAVTGAHLEKLVHRVRSHLATHGSLSTADFKELTGLSRRMAIPLLEWLDARRVTLRQGDVRVAHPSRG